MKSVRRCDFLSIRSGERITDANWTENGVFLVKNWLPSEKVCIYGQLRYTNYISLKSCIYCHHDKENKKSKKMRLEDVQKMYVRQIRKNRRFLGKILTFEWKSAHLQTTKAIQFIYRWKALFIAIIMQKTRSQNNAPGRREKRNREANCMKNG